MDILTHTLSGVAIGTVLTSFSNKGFRNKLGLIAISGFGAALPDLDAISLWPKFDTTIGKLLGLQHSGQEIYFSKFWYSHHGFLHSLFACLLIVLTFGTLAYLIKSRFTSISLRKLIQSFRNGQIYFIGFVVGFTIHLLEDMPTPGSVWGGVNFFWPSESYIGGTGDIWWWNNYDIFLIVIGVILFNGLIQASKKWIRIDIRKLTTAIFILGFSLSLLQIKTRKFEFDYSGHTQRYQEYEHKSKGLQKQIVGDKIYHIMLSLDRKLPINF